jgi:hypothetical protein
VRIQIGEIDMTVRISRLATALGAVLFIAPACVPPPAPRPAPPKAAAPAGTFLETFNGAPAAPTRFASANWDISVHSREHHGETMDAMHAQHGADCSAPPATHAISRFDQAVFQCRDHVMTAMNAGGYGEIVLTPNRLVDFSKGEAVISVDVSTLVTSRRDWWDIWITPFNENIQLPCEVSCADLQGPPRRAVHVYMTETFSGTTGFRAEIHNNFTSTEVPGDFSTGYEAVLKPDAARRDKFELRISRTHIKFGMPGYGLTWVNAPISNLGWDVGVVQFAHHSYTPEKDEAIANPHANTWHWDNVSIKPARPFKMIRAQQRAVTSTATFATASPANARLRFAAYGTSMQVSFNGGKTWTNATRQAQSVNATDAFASYWTPMPAGVKSVQFRGQPGCCPSGPAIRDVSIWAL